MKGIGAIGGEFSVGNRGSNRGTHGGVVLRSEEHTSELQSQSNLVCRLLLEKKKVEPMNRPTLRLLLGQHSRRLPTERPALPSVALIYPGRHNPALRSFPTRRSSDLGRRSACLPRCAVLRNEGHWRDWRRV